MDVSLNAEDAAPGSRRAHVLVFYSCANNTLERLCMKEVELGGEKSFIGAWYIPDLKVCDELIAFFKTSDGKVPGEIGHDRQVNKDIKDSLDLIVTPEQFSIPVIRKYIINLYEVVKQY